MENNILIIFPKKLENLEISSKIIKIPCAEHRFLAGGRPGALFSEKVRNLVIFTKNH